MRIGVSRLVRVGLPLVGLSVFVSLPARADYLLVRRPATVKEAAHRDAEVLLRCEVGDTLALVPVPQQNGYYCVELPHASERGWIYRTLVRRHTGQAPDGAMPPHSGRLEVHVINVGQADAILIRCPDGNHEMLIDAADTRYPQSGRRFEHYLTSHQSRDNEIEVVIATHPHADHIGHMAWVLRRYSVGLYVDNGNEYDSATFRRTEDAWAERNPRYWSTQDELVPLIDFCPRPDVSAVVLRPEGFGQSHDPNDNSVVVRVDYGEDSFLFVGDAGREEEELLAADQNTLARLDCDFLKAGHHASETSSNEPFLQRVTPQIVAISCGARDVGTNTTYMHPRREKVAALLLHAGPRQGPPVLLQAFDSVTREWSDLSLDRAVYVTVVDGDLVFESDGQGIRKR